MKRSFKYVDGFVVPVPKKNIPAYKKMAKLMGRVWRDYGALDYVECMADDVTKGKITSFPQSVKLKKSETVFLSWITYKSRGDRDRVMKKVMSDPRLQEFMDPKKMPFDGMRMFGAGLNPWCRCSSERYESICGG